MGIFFFKVSDATWPHIAAVAAELRAWDEVLAAPEVEGARLRVVGRRGAADEPEPYAAGLENECRVRASLRRGGGGGEDCRLIVVNAVRTAESFRVDGLPRVLEGRRAYDGEGRYRDRVVGGRLRGRLDPLEVRCLAFR